MYLGPALVGLWRKTAEERRGEEKNQAIKKRERGETLSFGCIQIYYICKNR